MFQIDLNDTELYRLFLLDEENEGSAVTKLSEN